jgi:hypothetical protein
MSAAPAIAATPLRGLSCEITPEDLALACICVRDIEMDVGVARLLHGALCAAEAKDTKNLRILLGLASGKLRRQAAKPPVDTQQAKQLLAHRIEGIAAMVSEDAIMLEIRPIRDDIVASLKGRWGKPASHDAIRKLLIEGVESDIAKRAKDARIFEIGVVLGVTVGVGFVVPRSFNDEDNAAVGSNAFLFEKVGSSWVPLTRSPVRKSYAATVGFYLAVKDAVNTRPEIAEHLRTILLAAIGSTSPWHKVISDGDFKSVPLIHLRGTTGLALYQLAIVPGSITPELAHVMATIKANMTSNAAGPIYFTIIDEWSEAEKESEAARGPTAESKSELSGVGGDNIESMRIHESEAAKESDMCIGESSASKRVLTEEESVEAVEDPPPLAKSGRLATFESQ